MNCGEFRSWFAILLSGGDATNWPEREYQLHSLRCPACRMLLSTHEITEAVTDVASMASCSVEEMLVGEKVLRGIRRRMVVRRIFRRASLAVVIGAVVLLVVLIWRGGPAEEAPPREAPEVAVLPDTPEGFAAGLATEGFSFQEASQVRSSRSLTFVFNRSDADADQYEFVKSVAISGFDRAFPDAPLLTVCIIAEDGSSLLRVLFRREALRGATGLAAARSGAQFCRAFYVLNDTDGKALPRKEDVE